MARFRTRYGKPSTLTDRYAECRPEDVAGLLAKPTTEFGWVEFNRLYLVGVAPATYEEGLYFLPDAFGFLRRNPNDDAVHCVSDVIWFLSEHARRLEEDGLLAECRDQIRDLLGQRLTSFAIIHWDRVKNREMGFDRDSHDFVEQSQLVEGTLETLFRFRTLAGWATEFLAGLKASRDQPMRSAWFLECVARAKRWAHFRGAKDDSGNSRVRERMFASHPPLKELWAEFVQRGMVQELPDSVQPGIVDLERHAEVIRHSGALFEEHPTYWGRLFHELGLAAGEPGGSRTAPHGSRP